MKVKVRSLMVLATLVVVGIFLGASHASAASAATLHPLIPGGIPSNNVNGAFSFVMSRASIDTATSSAIASTSGASSFIASDYVAVGFTNGAPAGSANTGISGNGALVPTGDTAHCNLQSRMFVIKNVKKGGMVFFCTSCGNIRVFVHRPVPFNKFVAGTVVRVNQTFHRSFTHTCPSGETVNITVTSWVYGLITAKTWGEVQGKLSIKIKAAIKLKMNQTIKVKCFGIPTTTVNFGKKWLNSAGQDITNSKSGESVPVVVGVFDVDAQGNSKQVGNTISTTIHPGTFTVKQITVKKDQWLYACVPQEFETSKNVDPADDNGNPNPNSRCKWQHVTNPGASVTIVFTNREKAAAPPPPPCNCQPTPTPPTPTPPPPTPAPKDPAKSPAPSPDPAHPSPAPGAPAPNPAPIDGSGPNPLPDPS
jgi:hypothetical protein